MATFTNTPNFGVRCADIYHGDDVLGNDCIQGMKMALDAGVWGVVHKSNEGRVPDPAYMRRRKAAEKVGMAWGAYVFNSMDNVKDQAAYFFKYAQPDKNTLVQVDYETDPHDREPISVHELVSLCKLIEDKLGRPVVIYSGFLLKETITQLGSDEFDYITSHRLWVADYRAKPSLPKGFKNYWMWQYTGDGLGPNFPRKVAGINVGPQFKGTDLNIYNGTKEQFLKDWIS
jgi:lysozyme